MSRTYRRKNVPEWWAYKYRELVSPIDKDGNVVGKPEYLLSGENKIKSLAHLHSDKWGWNSRICKYARKIHESRHRQDTRQELTKFMYMLGYEPLFSKKKRVHYCWF